MEFKIKIKPNYIIIPAIALVTLLVGNYFTWTGIQWYKNLKLPFFTPPNWVFPYVWRLIFFCTTISALSVWNRFERGIMFWATVGLFVCNAFLNGYWSYLFFNQHLIGFAVLDVIILFATVIGLIYLISPQSRVTALLLFPYAVWTFFTIVLNIAMWSLN